MVGSALRLDEVDPDSLNEGGNIGLAYMYGHTASSLYT